MPSLASCEMLGGTKTPNGVFNSTPPASSSRASPSAFGFAWHEAQPPASKMRSPFLASPGPIPASVAASSRTGADRNQPAAAPAPATTTAAPASLRSQPMPRLSLS